MTNKKCLYCYKEVLKDGELHASCSRKFFGTKTPPVIPYSLDEMNELAKKVVQRSVTVPGVQPKLSMSLIKETGQNYDRRLTVVDALGGNFIFKPPTPAFKEMPANEHVTMRIAEAYGLKVVSSSLIRLKSGELSYITKRIDRTKDYKKVHMLDMFQITEAFDKYISSMEKVGKAVENYSANPLLDKLFLFEITLFCFLTGNNDMHLKNFSMIQNKEKWILAPFYDLLNVSIILPEDTEELALTMEGKKRKLNRKSFETYGKNLGLNNKQINGVFQRFLKNKPKALRLIEHSFLSEEMQIKYIALLDKRYEALY